MDFMGENFLLDNDPARILFFEHARDMPIFDYHNHLSPRDIYRRRRYDNLAQLWLEEDHYKWRAMRAVGIDEFYITGAAPEYEKYLKWAHTVERLPGNPLYHWTHLELRRYFGIEEPLGPDSAPGIWERCGEMLQQPGYDALGLLQAKKVVALCTTDDPADSLEWHQKIAQAPQGVQVQPTFRPDRFLHPDKPAFPAAVEALSRRFGRQIANLAELKETLRLAMDTFQAAGCLSSDQAFVQFVYARGGNPDGIFEAAMNAKALTGEEIAAYSSDLLRFLAGEYARRGIVMQLRFGTLRNNNTPMMRTWGPDGGFDSVGECTRPAHLAAFLDDMVTQSALPRSVLYCLNPGDNPVFSTMAVNFASGEVPGKVQFGNAWWFADNVRGISNQLSELMETGLLSGFIGMLTDSRSFTSFSRHEFFRRILCNILGGMIHRGEYPKNYDKMGQMVRDICFHNAARYFCLPI